MTGQRPESLTVDSDSVVGLDLLPMPVSCPTPESPLIDNSHSWKEEGTIEEDSSHTVPGASLGREDLPSFSPSCVLQRREKPKQAGPSGQELPRQDGMLGTLKDSS